MFDTPASYAEHLGTIIEDDDLIELAVRRKFPKYLMPTEATVAEKLTAARFKEEGSKKPTARHDAWMCSDAQDRNEKSNMIAGSQKLLLALWHNHPRVLMVLGASGHKVASPC